jgi:hypothetical protein
MTVIHEDYVTHTGYVDVVHGDHCIIRGSVTTNHGDHNTIHGDVTTNHGNDCTILGNIHTNHGYRVRVSGAVTVNHGSTTRIGTGRRLGTASEARGSGSKGVVIRQGNVINETSDGGVGQIISFRPGSNASFQQGRVVNITSGTGSSGDGSIFNFANGITIASNRSGDLSVIAGKVYNGGRHVATMHEPYRGSIMRGGKVYDHQQRLVYDSATGQTGPGAVEGAGQRPGPAPSSPSSSSAGHNVTLVNGSAVAFGNGARATVSGAVFGGSVVIGDNNVIDISDDDDGSSSSSRMDLSVDDVDVEEQRRIERELRQKQEEAQRYVNGVRAPLPLPAGEEEPTTEDDRLACTICMDRVKSCICVPCYHKNLCIACARDLLQREGRRTKCPTCRKDVAEIARVYE